MLGNTSRRIGGRLLATGQPVLPVWKVLCFPLWVLSNRLEKEQSCTEKPHVHISKGWETAWEGGRRERSWEELET